jgi:transcriptional regulator with XRE-family HTH domain
MSHPVPSIGPQLRALRNQLRWSQKFLSNRCGMRRADIAQVETGYNSGRSPRFRKALAKGFGVPTDTLYEYFDGQISLEKVTAQVPAVTAQDPQRVLHKLRVRSGVRVNPYAVLPLAAAIRMLAQESPLRESEIAETARGILERVDDPYGTPAAVWFRTLDDELGRCGFEQRQLFSGKTPRRAKRARKA